MASARTASVPGQASASSPLRELFRTTLFPLFLLLTCPPAILILWVTAVHLEGSLLRLLSADGWSVVAKHWPMPSLSAAKIVLVFAVFETVLLVALPGKVHEGPITPKGNRPRYKLNGIAAFFITHAAFYLAAFHLKWFSPAIVYDHFGSILATLSGFSLVVCLALYVKGAYFPSTTDCGRSGNFIWDYYWGVELHPQIAGVHLKQLANCRLGMMGWSVILVSFAAKQVEMHGALSNSMLVSVLLQLVYILKFFYWEGGYFGTLDIMHDRFGFYICWGVLAWLPSVYTLATLYLAGHPYSLHPAYAGFLVAFGIAAIWANYDADAQRQRVRQTQGKTTVWGKKPEVIVAEYRTADGKTHTNLLLVSGWWKLSRHFHYISELALALAWTLPAGMHHLLPYFYLIFLTILLVDRSGRDELRCRQKYGRYWAEYCERVRYRLVPFIY